MGKIISFVILFGVAAAMLLQCAEAQTVHVVGDSLGWIVPPNGASAYESWATSKTFVVEFNFTTGEHDVVRVPKDSFDSCSSANAIGDAVTTGPANITLTNAGDHYYICTFTGHCQAGQKLSITVSGSPGAVPPTSTQAPPDSSSSGVFASFLVSLLSVAVVFLF